MYDCTLDVLKHRQRVIEVGSTIIVKLISRLDHHDESKLHSPEKETFDYWTPELRTRTFGSDSYKKALDEMGDGVKHHYLANSHHPEHHLNGVNGMTLIDICEMFADWCAVCAAKGEKLDLRVAQERFHLSDQLVDILSNTASELGV